MVFYHKLLSLLLSFPDILAIIFFIGSGNTAGQKIRQYWNNKEDETYKTILTKSTSHLTKSTNRV